MLDWTDAAKVDETEELWSPAADDNIEATGTGNGAVNDVGTRTGTAGTDTLDEAVPTRSTTVQSVQGS